MGMEGREMRVGVGFIILILITRSMIAENQEYERSQMSQNEEAAQNLSEADFDLVLDDQGLQKLPLLQRYLSNRYEIFKQDQLSFARLLCLKNKSNLQDQKKFMLAYFSQSPSATHGLELKSRLKGQISEEFVINLHAVPPYSMVYLSIMETKANRLNMIVRNHHGEWLAYFQKQRKCKKLPKILKTLNQVRKPFMAIILDQSLATEASIPEIKSLGQVANEFLYIFHNADNIVLKNDTNVLRSEKSQQAEESCCIQLYEDHLIISSPNVSSLPGTQVYDALLATMSKHNREEEEALAVVKGKGALEERSLRFDFIFSNVLRTWICSPTQTIVIIQRLFMKQQQAFNKKDHVQKQKQIEKEQSLEEDGHYCGKMKESKPCKGCLNGSKRKTKKTNFKCLKCSLQLKKDIPLCLDCFGEFHSRLPYYHSRIKKRPIRRRPRFITHRNTNQTLEHAIIPFHEGQKCQTKIKADCVKDSYSNPFSPSLLDNTRRLYSLMKQSFQCMKKLEEKELHNQLNTFLLYFGIKSQNRMKQICLQHPEFATGLTDQVGNYRLEAQKDILIAKKQALQGFVNNEDVQEKVKKEQNFD